VTEERGAQAARLIADEARRSRQWLERFRTRIASGGTLLNPGEWLIARQLVRAGLLTKPRSASYITLMPWALDQFHRARPALRDELLADPGLLQDEVFDLFTVEGAASALQTADNWAEDSDGRAHPEWGWRVTLAQLAAEGHADRGRLLDACLGAFFRDFPAGQLTWYVRFHAELAPDAGELAARSGSYLRLLAGDAGTAVGIGQKAVGTLLAHGRIDPAEIVKASGAVLARPEKKYPAAQLRLLGVIARQHEDLSENAIAAAAVAFEHPLTDVQEQALDLAARYDRRLGPGTRERLRAAASSLAPSLRQRAQAVLGVRAAGSGAASDGCGAPGDTSATGPEAASGGISLAGALPAAAALPRVSSLAELVSAGAALAADQWDPALTEQVLDGIARFGADRAAFTAAVKPLARRLESGRTPRVVGSLPLMLMVSLQAAGQAQAAWTAQAKPSIWARRRSRRPGGAAPLALLWHRVLEVRARVTDGQARPLLAYPDTAAGHVDPERIVATIAAMEDAGELPWPDDFTQALLRLPRDDGQQLIPAAARLRSPAGRALADVMRRGAVTDPLTELARERDGTLVADRYVPRVTSAPLASPVTMRIDRSAPRPADPLARIWKLAAYTWTSVFPQRELLIWAHALPSHREIAAAHALFVICGMDRVPERMRPDGRFVAGLPHMHGPAGPAVALALAHCLSAHEARHRAAAVEALTGFGRSSGGAGAHQGLDGGLVGRILVEMQTTRFGRVAECLQSAGADPGTRVLAWQIASAAIPGLLRSGARDTHRVLSVAAELAAATGAHGHIDGLAEAAARSGSSRLSTEARRLHALL